MKRLFTFFRFTSLVLCLHLSVDAISAAEKPVVNLTRSQIEEIVIRSYQYVAMFNVNNKFALDQSNPMATGGWNRVKANTTLLDHTMRAIARPNNDTLYIGAAIDIRAEPVILESPAFDSKYVSLMVTGYDHFVNVPMSTRFGDFAKPSRILFYTKRTPGYAGEKVDGVDKVMEATGDFISAVYRVMPHLNEPARMQRNLAAMRSVKLKTLSEYRGQPAAKPRFLPWTTPGGSSANLDEKRANAEFPETGKTDFDVFENNLLEVMQFVFNHTTFDPGDELDRKLLAVYRSLGVVPGTAFDPARVPDIDGALFREVAESVAKRELAKAVAPGFMQENGMYLFLPKGQMTLERLLFQSVIGPIGLPLSEAAYPMVTGADGKLLNAQHDYVIRMKKNELPPARAFWSVTLYDTANGFFIPNGRKKYSVGENAGYRLDADGGITIHIATQRPPGVPEENWLPVNRKDEAMDVVMRIYQPDLDRYKDWKAPKAERSDRK